MRLLPFLLAALLPALSAAAQEIDYYGFADDVHPVRLTLPHTGLDGRLWIGSATQSHRLTGTCHGTQCTYKGVDTALTFRFALDRERGLQGGITFGDGRQQRVLAKAYLGPKEPLSIAVEVPERRSIPGEFVGIVQRKLRPGRAAESSVDRMTYVETEEAFAPDFLTRCGSPKWVTAWSTASADHRLTLATLPNWRMQGSLYLASVNATFLVQGERHGREMHLAVSRPDGTPTGEMWVTADAGEGDYERLSAKLDLGAGPQDFRLAVAERMPLGCRQAQGRFDLLMPVVDQLPRDLPATPGAATELPLSQLADHAWTTLLGGESKLGSGWFEPTRLDADLLSGWLHVQTDAGYESFPLNLDRHTRYLIGEGLFNVGPRRPRERELSQNFHRAVLAHPLHADAAFQGWIEGQHLTEVTVVAEGLAYATDRHPVYGRLVWIEPWQELSIELGEATSWLRAKTQSP